MGAQIRELVVGTVGFFVGMITVYFAMSSVTKLHIDGCYEQLAICHGSFASSSAFDAEANTRLKGLEHQIHNFIMTKDTHVRIELEALSQKITQSGNRLASFQEGISELVGEKVEQLLEDLKDDLGPTLEKCQAA
eukprot:TRINITY_DN15530_c0_g1_i1.p2 TRINITY_DN15530_c0_g1~~TRINITY_DN15530_c0_g1_i1.p2  ORF type:complete len:135 (+),score=33.50 TRINITY_DN15530_c0_g1_i1:349-753(+)